MTIRLRCAECQRKLKVPDEALGKKVQCPACGARFLGRLDADVSPPAAPFPNFQLEETAAHQAREPMAVDEPAAVKETDVMEAVAPEEEGVEPIVMEDETEAVNVGDEIEEAAEPEVVEEDEPPAKKKKSRRTLYLLLALGVVLLLACGGIGGVVYFLFST